MPGPGFTLVQLRYFAATVELGSMTQAAKTLLVSQSSISAAIAQLEKELGVQLLLRHRARGVTLTTAGRDFHSKLRTYLTYTTELAEVAQSAGGSLVGDLAVGCFTTLTPFELPRLINACAEANPQLRVQVTEDEHAALIEALQSGRCEIALMYGFDLDDEVDQVHVAEAFPYVLLPQQHRLAERHQISLHELADEPMVLLDLPHSGDYIQQLVRSVGVQPEVRYRTSGFESVRVLVANGLGWSVLTQRPVNNVTYDGSRLVTVSITDPVPSLDIVIAYPRGARLTRKAQAFIRSSIAARRGADGPPISSIPPEGL